MLVCIVGLLIPCIQALVWRTLRAYGGDPTTGERKSLILSTAYGKNDDDAILGFSKFLCARS